jgi:hypothetical protein
MKCMRRMAKYTWQDYRTNEYISSELKLAQLYRKFRITEMNGYMIDEWAETDRLPQLILKYQPCGKRSQ